MSDFVFFPGEDRKLEIELYTSDDCGKESPYQIDTGGGDTVSVELPASPANLTFTLASSPPVVVDSAEKWKISIELSSTQIDQLVNGSALITVTKAGKKRKFLAESAIRRLTLPSC